MRRRRRSDDPHVHAGEPAAGMSHVAVDVRAGLTSVLAEADACIAATSGSQSDLSSATTNVTVVEDAAHPLPTIRPLAVTERCDRRQRRRRRTSATSAVRARSTCTASQITEADAKLGVQGDLFLSNLPADYDLVLYGRRSTPLRNQPTSSVGYVDDVQYDLNPLDDPVQADTVQDVPQTLPTTLGFNPADYVPVAISSNRGVNDEQIETGTLRAGTYYVQISAYNAAFSDAAVRAALPHRRLGQLATARPAPTYPTGGAGRPPRPRIAEHRRQHVVPRERAAPAGHLPRRRAEASSMPPAASRSPSSSA